MTATKALNKSMIPSLEDMTRNLLTWYALASSNPAKLALDLEWYQTAHDECVAMRERLESEGIAITLDKVIDVVACISPGMPWDKNIQCAYLVIVTWHLYRTPEERHRQYLNYHTGIAHGWRNYDNAWGVLDGTHVLSAQASKTYRFGDNLRNPQSTVYATIDQHMIHVICDTGLRGSIQSGVYYETLESAVIHTALILGIPQHKLQAAVWACRVDLFKAGYEVSTIRELLEGLGEKI